MGSGSTAIASKQLKRKFIGFEINEKYHQESMQRLKYVPEELVLNSA